MAQNYFPGLVAEPMCREMVAEPMCREIVAEPMHYQAGLKLTQFD